MMRIIKSVTAFIKYFKAVKGNGNKTFFSPIWGQYFLSIPAEIIRKPHFTSIIAAHKGSRNGWVRV